MKCPKCGADDMLGFPIKVEYKAMYVLAGLAGAYIGAAIGAWAAVGLSGIWAGAIGGCTLGMAIVWLIPTRCRPIFTCQHCGHLLYGEIQPPKRSNTIGGKRK